MFKDPTARSYCCYACSLHRFLRHLATIGDGKVHADDRRRTARVLYTRISVLVPEISAIAAKLNILSP